MTPTHEWMRSQTERIHTLCPDPGAKRALVVWNTTFAEISGTAVFHADYTLRTGTRLPEIKVESAVGDPVVSRVCDYQDLPTEAPDRVCVVFDLAFDVAALPARSWRTYFASYDPSSRTVSEPAGFQARLDPDTVVVLETLCREGDLPLSGRF